MAINQRVVIKEGLPGKSWTSFIFLEFSDNGCPRSFPDPPRSFWVYLYVEDSGPGIPDELRERIFDAFFTSKPMGRGTGLGLSVSRQLIRAVGGELELVQERSDLGGAKFLIRLPKIDNSGET